MAVYYPYNPFFLFYYCNQSNKECNITFFSSDSVYVVCFIYNSYFEKNSQYLNKFNLFKVLILPAILVVIFSNIQSSTFNITENVQSRISSIDINEYSTNSRIRYFSHAISSIFDRPLGVGLGNWQIESIEADSQDIKSYIVPYHVHNDFLELSADVSVF